MTLRDRRLVVIPALLAALAIAGLPALAVSDGNYDAARQGCSGNADDSDHPQYTEEGCYSATLQITGAKHRYVLVGVPQTPDGTNANAVVVCLDFTGTAKCARADKDGFTPLPDQKGTPIDPESAELHAYFGADDNLDSGEHDGSEAVANGPSDGGAIVANVTPLSALDWLAQVTGGDTQFFFTHPLPAADAGAGGCADGLCFSVQTQRRIAYKAGGKHPKTRSAADYEGHEWDPPDCAGPSDTAKDCGGRHKLAWWHKRNQTTYVEPGLQIYEDPDPQGSPEGPYPLPALYIGTCGFVAGGGDVAFPDSPITNGAGQLVVKTGC